MHAASNDILILQRDYDFAFNSIFDTQLAARILGWQRIGLAAILEEKFGVISDKRMQRTNWGRRPLTPQQLSYAQMDTHYLLALRRMLIDELHAQGRMEEACEAFQIIAGVDYQDRPTQERSVWQMKAARTMPHKSMGILAALWEWREGEAQQQNRPPFKILTDQALVHIAKKRPRSLHDLRKIRGLGNTQVGRYGRDIVRVIREGQKRPPPASPSSRERSGSIPEKLVLDRYDALRQWRTHQANNRGVDPDIVFSNDTLLSIAKRAPTSESALQEIPEIGPWKARTYGPDVLAILAEHGE
jgi:ribonuclease D